jgi:hypothetical protein
MNLYLETRFKEQFERVFSSADHESLYGNWKRLRGQLFLAGSLQNQNEGNTGWLFP